MRQKARGMAMLTVLGIVVLLTVIVTFALTISGRERREAGKLIHNLTIQQMTEGTLQRARGFFAQNYSAWGTYLTYFVVTPLLLQPASQIPLTLNTLTTDHPELINPNTPSGFSCYMYLRDNVDEFTTVNDPKVDSDQLVFVGAVCVQTVTNLSDQSTPLIAELTAPIVYTSPVQYGNQSSGGTLGANNSSVVAGYR